MSLREMQPDSPVMQHCATCADCASLTTRLRAMEYDTASTLNHLLPLTSPISLAETSATLSRRRRVGRLVVTLSGIIGAIIVAVVASTMLIPQTIWNGITGPVASSALRTETITLTCLSPEQAGEIISPYVRSHGSVYYTPRLGLSVITVRGTEREIQRSRALLDELEGDPAAACRHPNDPAMADIEGGAGADLVPPKLSGTSVREVPAPRPKPAPAPTDR
ncbi:MAG TPA: hypothetical protein VJ825_01950 [Gemmatimonadaceae bacterium]|nr:hypothetical protein [Gemmatimonadaceae bacterium]